MDRDKRVRLAAALGSVMLVAPSLGQGAGDAPSPESRIEFRVSPVLDLHLSLRRAAAGQPVDPSLDQLAGWQAALDAARNLESALGGARGWQQIEGNLADRSDAGEVAEAFAELPESLTFGGQARALREPAVAYARAMQAVEPAFLAGAWPVHEAAIERARADLASNLEPNAGPCLRHVIESLGMTDPGVTIPVYLVRAAPDPGASTVLTRDGRGVCFVGVDGASGSMLAEIVLHETVHALDVATRDQDHALNALRRRLEAAGVDRRRPLWRDTWHTLMFIQAGETIRRIVDPAHAHYGDAAGYYAGVQRVTDAARTPWLEYLDGRLSVDQSLDRIVAGVTRTP